MPRAAIWLGLGMESAPGSMADAEGWEIIWLAPDPPLPRESLEQWSRRMALKIPEDIQVLGGFSRRNACIKSNVSLPGFNRSGVVFIHRREKWLALIPARFGGHRRAQDFLVTSCALAAQHRDSFNEVLRKAHTFCHAKSAEGLESCCAEASFRLDVTVQQGSVSIALCRNHRFPRPLVERGAGGSIN